MEHNGAVARTLRNVVRRAFLMAECDRLNGLQRAPATTLRALTITKSGRTIL